MGSRPRTLPGSLLVWQGRSMGHTQTHNVSQSTTVHSDVETASTDNGDETLNRSSNPRDTGDDHDLAAAEQSPYHGNFSLSH